MREYSKLNTYVPIGIISIVECKRGVERGVKLSVLPKYTSYKPQALSPPRRHSLILAA